MINPLNPKPLSESERLRWLHPGGAAASLSLMLVPQLLPRSKHLYPETLHSFLYPGALLRVHTKHQKLDPLFLFMPCAYCWVLGFRVLELVSRFRMKLGADTLRLRPAPSPPRRSTHVPFAPVWFSHALVFAYASLSGIKDFKPKSSTQS